MTGLRAMSSIRREIAVDWHGLRKRELLWLPDIVAGAATWRLDGQTEYLARVGHQERMPDP
ncbi:MAG TPA: hypothetical protein VLJ59_06190 [Mycobacteriales bacterium]|nr:hypothetical protein [Mycobacteriales bacterium]